MMNFIPNDECWVQNYAEELQWCSKMLATANTQAGTNITFGVCDYF